MAGPARVDPAIAEAVAVSQPTVARVRRQSVAVSQPTVARVRRQSVAQGLEAALNRRAPRREYRRKLDGEQEAHVFALACSTPPAAPARWSLRLLTDRMVALEHVEGRSYQKETSASPG